MNDIQKSPITALGYNFIPDAFLPEGKDEYYLRYQQNNNNKYRLLTADEINRLVQNGNTSNDWNKVLVSDVFDTGLVKSCQFYGLVRIGNLEPYYLEFHNLRSPVGLYNSTIISCDLGDNVVIDNVNYLSHYIIGNDVMIVNVNELATTGNARFGNGIVKDGDPEKSRIRMEVCNENGGRSIIPFDGMLPGDAWFWSRYRGDADLQEKLIELTQHGFDPKRGYYGTIGERTVIKNTRIIKDVIIGSDAYIKGANKLKNLTINSSPNAKTQIGEGCELVNGIIGTGCRIFYGVKAVRFMTGSNSQLKYGARLINSYLGDNSTISCCEVLNSLIFPAHEQHHNNSFLCAALVMGQSNIAAGATIGSNHNSRSPDGEIIAGRGFWPGLCVSLKHNSKFASYTILAKGDYPSELDIPFPFSLVSNDVSNNQLVIIPGYWFMYNMYALARNAWKYVDRDKRARKIQSIEYGFLAPDTVNELFAALQLLEQLTPDEKGAAATNGMENSSRKTIVLKVPQSVKLFKELIKYYGTLELFHHFRRNSFSSFDTFKATLTSKEQREEWLNAGGQLVPRKEIDALRTGIRTGKIKSWKSVHSFYEEQSAAYPAGKLEHAYASLLEVLKIDHTQFTPGLLKELLQQSVATKEWMCKGIYDSRAKDYDNHFRKMMYDTAEEMNAVLGRLEDNAFIKQEEGALLQYKQQAGDIINLL
ncbi:MAG TPA: DUF4954 family protein [Chitinophagaceae bacterium]|nr:DUF4954 family protein [Chitinophagaceae bacterium]